MAIVKFELLENNEQPSCRPHTHTYYELYYLLDGNRDYLIGNAIFKLYPGTFALIKPNLLHKTEGTRYSRILIYFDKEFAKNLPETILESCFHKKSIIVPEDQRETTLKLLMAFDRLSEFSDYEANLLATSYLTTLLIHINRFHDERYQNGTSGSECDYPEIIIKTIDFLNRNFMNEITLEDISTHVYLSPSYLCRFFKKHTKINLFEYLNTIRLNKAIELLDETKMNISQIALETGFSSANYLCLQLKKHLNITPVKYRKMRTNFKT